MARRTAAHTTQAKKRKIGELRHQASHVQKVDGQAVVPHVASNRASIMKINSVLQEQGFIVEEDREVYTTKALARRMLDSLNCTEIGLGNNYTLVRNQTFAPVIDNPNITVNEAAVEKNIQISANNSFSEDCDPFYELDDQKPNSITDAEEKLKQVNKADLILTANFIAQLNSQDRTVRLKQFMDRQAQHRSHY